MTGAWSQPPEAPPPPVERGRLPVDQFGQQPQLPPQVVFGRDGMTMQMLAPGGAGQQGALALSEKYVFVLLDGQLYQYDIDTLALRNQARVAPPAGVAQRPFAVRVEPRPPVIPPDPNRAWLGVSLQALPEDLAKQHGLAAGAGALVTEVVIGSPADKAGLKAGDVIVSFDGQPVPSLEELVNRVRTTDVGKKAPIEILRNGERKTVTVETTKMPDLLGR
jgi:membrane-associated protease RseP (regulator of RpoE activity)